MKIKILSMNSVFTKTLLCSAVLFLSASCSDDSKVNEPEVNEPESFELNIISTNDVHGYGLTPTDESIGFSRMVGYANSLEEQGKEVLILDAGDMIAGNAVTNLDKGASAIDALNVVQYDAMTMGNHALDFGPDRFLELADKMTYPYVVANLFQNDEAVFEPYLIKTINDVNVAIVGLVTPDFGASEFYYEDPVVTMNRLMHELQAQASVIIVIAHLGEESEISSSRLAESVDGIDLILDGHDHVATPGGTMVGDTLIVNSGDNFTSFGYTTLSIVDEQVTTKSARLVDMTDETLKNSDDEDVSAVLADIKAKGDAILSEVLADSPVRLEGEREIIRRGGTNLGRLVADAFREDSGADISLMNSGWIRASASAGEITMQDVLNIQAMALQTGKVVTIPMTGKEVLEALEASYSADYVAETGFEQNGFLMQVSGLKADVDPTKLAGERISNVKVGGTDIILDQTYKAAVVELLNQIAGGYGMPFYAGEVEAVHSETTDALAEYLRTTSDAAFTLIEDKRMNIK